MCEGKFNTEVICSFSGERDRNDGCHFHLIFFDREKIQQLWPNGKKEKKKKKNKKNKNKKKKKKEKRRNDNLKTRQKEYEKSTSVHFLLMI